MKEAWSLVLGSLENGLDGETDKENRKENALRNVYSRILISCIYGECFVPQSFILNYLFDG